MSTETNCGSPVHTGRLVSPCSPNAREMTDRRPPSWVRTALASVTVVLFLAGCATLFPPDPEPSPAPPPEDTVEVEEEDGEIAEGEPEEPRPPETPTDDETPPEEPADEEAEPDVPAAPPREARDAPDPPAGPVYETDVERLREMGPVYTPYSVGPVLEPGEWLADLLRATVVPVIRRYDLDPDTRTRLWVLVDGEGRVADTVVQLTSGSAAFDSAARAAAERFRYRPAARDGEIVPVWVLSRVSLLMR